MTQRRRPRSCGLRGARLGARGTQKFEGNVIDTPCPCGLTNRAPVAKWHTIMSPMVDGLPRRTGGFREREPAETLHEMIKRAHVDKMTVFLSQDNRFPRTTSGCVAAMLSRMEPSAPKAVARRLRAIMAHLELEKVQDLADIMGAERSRASNWVNGYYPPPVPSAIHLLSKIPGLTLDWLYLGKADALPVALAIRLGALEELGTVPAVAEEPGAEEPPKAKGRVKASSRPRRAPQAI
jgi:hypothetical protein